MNGTYDYKSLFFEVYSAGFEAALSGEDFCTAYNKWYNLMLREAVDGEQT